MAGAGLIGLSIACILVALVPSSHEFRAFWRPTARPTLPDPSKDPNFYAKLQKVPPKEKTAKKLVKNFLRPLRRKSTLGNYLEDIVVVFDGSGSVEWCEFNKSKTAMKNVMQINHPSYDTKYAAVTFSNRASVNFQFLSPLEAAKKVAKLRYPGGSTNTQDGLKKALGLFQNPSAGSRLLSKKLVFLLTDGKSNINRHKTIPTAQLLKDRGLEIFVVAIGQIRPDGIQEIAAVATNPFTHLFRAKSNSQFLEIVRLAIKEVDPGLYQVLQGQYEPLCNTNTAARRQKGSLDTIRPLSGNGQPLSQRRQPISANRKLWLGEAKLWSGN